MKKFAPILLLLLVATPLAAQASTPDYATLERVYLNPAFARLDYDAYLADMAAIIDANPSKDESVLALLAADSIQKLASTPAPLYQSLKKPEKDDFKACGVLAPYFVRVYLGLAEMIEQDGNPARVAARWNGVTEAAICGPFSLPGSPCHDDVYGPELRLDFARDYAGPWGPIRFKPLPHDDPTDDKLEVLEVDRHQGSCYFIATILNVGADCNANLGLEISGPGKMWVRGVQVLDIDTRARDYPHIYVPVRLAKGDNVVLVKVSSASNIRLRVRGADGRPIAGLTARRPDAKAGPFDMRLGAPLVDFPTVPLTARFAAESRKLLTPAKPPAADLRKAALCELALGALNQRFAMLSEASLNRDKALALLPAEAGVVLAYVRGLDDSPLYSSSAARRARRHELRRLLDAAPCAAAWLELGVSLAHDERTREAMDCFDKALKANPKAFLACLEMADHFRQLGWTAEWAKAINQAREIAAGAPLVLEAAARLYEAENAVNRQLECWRAYARVYPNDSGVRLAMVSTLLRLGEGDAALELARIEHAANPYKRFSTERLIDVCFATGKVDEAVSLCRELAAKSSQPERYLNMAGKGLVGAGDTERAMKVFEDVLKASPAQHDVRRMLQRLKGEDGEFWREYSLSFDDARKVEPAAPPGGRASSALILDEMIQRVFEDGSSISYVHQVRKVLTQDGVDARGRDRINGEMILARTIKADGTVLEPVSVQNNQVEYPGVEVGCYLEVAYLTFAGGNPYCSLHGDRFYFEDFEFREPYYISRWVLLTPQDMKLTYRARNLTEGPEVEIRQYRKANLNVNLWDVRRRRFVEREYFMPSALELIPWLEMYHPQGWQDKARRAAAYGLMRQRVTPLVQAKADELTRGLKTDEQKARAIYGWINANFFTSGDALGAHQALMAMAGDREDVFLSLCKAAGVHTAFAYVDVPQNLRLSRGEHVLVPDWVGPEPNDFSRFMVIIRGDNGARLFVDLRDRLRPFGAYGSGLDNAPAIVWEDGRYDQVFLPAGDIDRDHYFTSTRLKLAADGGAEVEGTLETQGELSYSMKEQYRTTPRDTLTQQFERELAEQFKGFQASELEFKNIGDVGVPLTRTFKGKVAGLAHVAKGSMSIGLSLEKAGLLLSVMATKDKREQDLMIDFDLHQEDELRVTPPEGWTFGELPPDTIYPCTPFLYSLTFELVDGTLVVRRKVAVCPGRISSADYGTFVGELARVRAAEDVSITLAPVAGNAAKPEDVKAR